MTQNLVFSTQDLLFNALEAKVGSKKALVELVCKLLSIGKSSAYKRMANDTPLSLSEGVILMRYLGQSFDQLILPYYERINFSGDALRKLPESYEQYLQNVNIRLLELPRLPI